MAGNQADSCEGLTTRQKIAVMQAFCNGKQIEFRSTRGGLYKRFEPVFFDWRVYSLQQEPFWDWRHYEFRIKESKD